MNFVCDVSQNGATKKAVLVGRKRKNVEDSVSLVICFFLNSESESTF